MQLPHSLAPDRGDNRGLGRCLSSHEGGAELLFDRKDCLPFADCERVEAVTQGEGRLSRTRIACHEEGSHFVPIVPRCNWHVVLSVRGDDRIDACTLVAFERAQRCCGHADESSPGFASVLPANQHRG